jgi:hypothetical protein
MDIAGVIFDESFHYVDHLAPFCFLKGCPLIVCEPSIAELVQKFYPNVQIIIQDLFELDLPPTIISCDCKQGIINGFYPQLQSEVLWLPHGMSDKGWMAPIFEVLEEETVLVYGKKLEETIRQRSSVQKIVRVGNFRHDYWMGHKFFYDCLLQSALPFPQRQKTYLYAPTWDDRENNSSFWKCFFSIVKALPSDCNLIVKIHPNTYRTHLVEIESLIGRFRLQNNLCFLVDFPPVYPLLNLCDVYIGDMSSIGYDFLYWKRPMFFIEPQNPSLYLYRCGTIVARDTVSKIFEMKEEAENLRQIKEDAYAEVFV